MNLKFFIASTVFIVFASTSTQATEKCTSSPDNRIEVCVSDDAMQPAYRVNFDKKPVLSSSKLGLAFIQAPEFSTGFELAGTEISSSNSTWEQPWGERKINRDHHQKLLAHFKHNKAHWQFDVEFKVFNDGLGFRYAVPEQDKLTNIDITHELTQFHLNDPDNITAWWIPARDWNRYEYPYNTTPIAELSMAHTPVTFRNNNSGVHMSIHEAALVDYAGMSLKQGRAGQLTANLAPLSDGILVKTKAGFHTPWRTIQIAENAVGLLNSNLILNLNEPNKLGDVSWVKPGKYVGIWWGMHVKENTWESGDKHGATTSETKRYMDFAAKYGFDGVLVEGWNIGWDGSWYFNGDVFSFTKPYPDFDIKEVTQYGANLGVKLIGHHETSGSVTNYRNQMEDAFDLYKELGVTQVKTGYVADGGRIRRVDEKGITRYEFHDSQFTVGEYLHSVTEAAKRKISINTHEPIKDTGLRRTYPNWIAREGARGQEFNAWGSPPNPPEHTAILPFTRMLAGPMDFTPGIFNMEFGGSLAAENRPQTTLAKQLALYVVLYSPIQMAADLPRHYLANMPAFQFIRDVPTDWQESVAIEGEIGDYVVIARKERDSEDWYVGGLTDEHARKLKLHFDFLDKGRRYTAQIYRDGDNAQWLTAPYDIVIEEKPVKHGDTLNINIAESGGFAIRLIAQ